MRARSAAVPGVESGCGRDRSRRRRLGSETNSWSARLGLFAGLSVAVLVRSAAGRRSWAWPLTLQPEPAAARGWISGSGEGGPRRPERSGRFAWSPGEAADSRDPTAGDRPDGLKRRGSPGASPGRSDRRPRLASSRPPARRGPCLPGSPPSGPTAWRRDRPRRTSGRRRGAWPRRAPGIRPAERAGRPASRGLRRPRVGTARQSRSRTPEWSPPKPRRSGAPLAAARALGRRTGCGTPPRPAAAAPRSSRPQAASPPARSRRRGRKGHTGGGRSCWRRRRRARVAGRSPQADRRLRTPRAWRPNRPRWRNRP